MLEVIGAGFPRTGTASLKTAIERLGYGPCYHMFELLGNPDHISRWETAFAGSDVDWDAVFAGYRSAQDWPASHFWRELADFYPEAKVVLTVRDPVRWYASFRRLLSLAPDRDRPERSLEMAPPHMARLLPLLDAMSGKVFGKVFGEGWRFGPEPPGEDLAVAAFHRHVAAVREALPEERLLVFEVAEGWEPICRFLGVEVPGEPFPRINDAESLPGLIEEAIRGGPAAPAPPQEHERGHQAE